MSAPVAWTDGPTAMRVTLDLVAPALRGAAARLWRPSGLTERYPAYLAAMYAVIRASVPLMEAAARRCTESSGALERRLREYLEEHIAEERDHDEWLLADLAAVGVDPETVRRALPDVAVARMVGAQYYWIHHHHPVGLLGYVAVLEGNAPSPLLAEHLAAATGLPDAAFRTVRHHAVLDLDHSAAIDRLLDELPLTAWHTTAVNVSALSTVETLVDLYTRLGGSDDRPTA
ncbi:iron-containing redox enzyme family protein [Phytohabitans sp. ZYX-F-186]|uniref:Iron-containing redox enzyme family protein n=1 Tax=Phytohabitans maris TaxID=3071409 RepID=A0ABU0ZWB5_9ACTN|nr:iron-containing redox enzyme family protein [Phytohabitans sp. ZYX-F-186]MDQ7911321.1 iron-containing redox enzyme family protein [Phytohabitans sp. ZYX-F-186]